MKESKLFKFIVVFIVFVILISLILFVLSLLNTEGYVNEEDLVNDYLLYVVSNKEANDTECEKYFDQSSIEYCILFTDGIKDYNSLDYEYSSSYGHIVTIDDETVKFTFEYTVEPKAGMFKKPTYLLSIVYYEKINIPVVEVEGPVE